MLQNTVEQNLYLCSRLLYHGSKYANLIHYDILGYTTRPVLV